MPKYQSEPKTRGSNTHRCPPHHGPGPDPGLINTKQSIQITCTSSRTNTRLYTIRRFGTRSTTTIPHSPQLGKIVVCLVGAQDPPLSSIKWGRPRGGAPFYSYPSTPLLCPLYCPCKMMVNMVGNGRPFNLRNKNDPFRKG